MISGPVAEAAPEKRIAMKLERHCRPAGPYEIVGHFRPEIRRKNPAGVMEVVRAEEFIKGEPAPPPLPGVGTTGKLWAGTIISLPEAEAKALKRAGIASVELADD
jgi:hypothetical protein